MRLNFNGKRILRTKNLKCWLFCYVPQLSTEKESLGLKGNVINTGSLFSAPDDKKSKTQ